MALFSQSNRPPPVPAGPPAALPLRKLAFTALGTYCEVQYAAPGGNGQAGAFERAAVAWVHGFEARYSRFRPDSLVSRINSAAGRTWIEVDAEMEGLLNLCDTLHVMTQGILDPTTLPLLRLWDHKASPPRLPTAGEIAAARALVGWKKVQRAPGKVFLPQSGMALEFGGFGKEYAVDVVAQLARDHGLDCALVDFGHDIRALGAPPGRAAWHIGLEDPRNPGTAAGRIAAVGKGIASSGDYLRSFVLNGRRYGHIVDPRTGTPVANGCVQATVIAGSCLHAGALSTTAFVLGVPAALEFIQAWPGAEALIVTAQARAQTRGFFRYVVS